MKYVSRRRPRASYWDDAVEELVLMPESLTVHEPEDAEWTGLLDQDGNDICRVRDPIGFRLR